jgi:hypothetical protein
MVDGAGKEETGFKYTMTFTMVQWHSKKAILRSAEKIFRHTLCVSFIAVKTSNLATHLAFVTCLTPLLGPYFCK